MCLSAHFREAFLRVGRPGVEKGICGSHTGPPARKPPGLKLLDLVAEALPRPSQGGSLSVRLTQSHSAGQRVGGRPVCPGGQGEAGRGLCPGLTPSL